MHNMGAEGTKEGESGAKETTRSDKEKKKKAEKALPTSAQLKEKGSRKNLREKGKEKRYLGNSQM